MTESHQSTKKTFLYVTNAACPHQGGVVTSKQALLLGLGLQARRSQVTFPTAVPPAMAHLLQTTMGCFSNSRNPSLCRSFHHRATPAAFPKPISPHCHSSPYPTAIPIFSFFPPSQFLSGFSSSLKFPLWCRFGGGLSCCVRLDFSTEPHR